MGTVYPLLISIFIEMPIARAIVDVNRAPDDRPKEP